MSKQTYLSSRLHGKTTLQHSVKVGNCLKNAIKQKKNIKWLDTAHPAYVKSLDV